MITNEQIEQLFAFCKKHYVAYYDVQIELVDHLANAIEEKMAADPSVSFDEALKQVYKTFGNRGFAPLVKEKEKAARRYNQKQVRKLFVEQLRWPKIFVALTVFAAIFSLLQLPNKDAARSFIVAGIAIPTFVILVTIGRLQRTQKRSGKKFLLVNLSGVINIFLLPLNSFNVINPLIQRPKGILSDISVTGCIFLSLLFAVYIVGLIASYQTVRHVKGVLVKSYPEVFAS
ncbi:MAG: hypothetical protein QM731_06595 [Chitinophagaceae bacterium]